MSHENSNSISRDVMRENDGILYVGIDLGTSRTSISASNGVRETVDSVVGYPRDVVSRKLLQKDILFGQEATRNRLALDIYRPLEKGVIKHSGAAGASSDDVSNNLEAARALIQYACSLARPQPGQLIYGVIGCPAQASIHNKQSIIEAARSGGTSMPCMFGEYLARRSATGSPPSSRSFSNVRSAPMSISV